MLPHPPLRRLRGRPTIVEILFLIHHYCISLGSVLYMSPNISHILDSCVDELDFDLDQFFHLRIITNVIMFSGLRVNCGADLEGILFSFGQGPWKKNH